MKRTWKHEVATNLPDEDRRTLILDGKYDGEVIATVPGEYADFIVRACNEAEGGPGLVEVCEAVVAWAKAPGDHGGNPYCKRFVWLAEQALVKAKANQPTQNVRSVCREGCFICKEREK